MSLIYLNVVLIEDQWTSRGEDINWQALFSLKAMLGLVKVTYCKTPTMDMYKDGSENGSIHVTQVFGT